MTQQPSNQQPSNRGRVPGLVIAFVQGLAYSVEVVFRSDIGERRCRQMALPLLLTLGAALLLTLHQENNKARLAAINQPGLDYPLPWNYPLPQVPSRLYADDLFNADGWHLGPYPMLLFCLLAVARHGYQRFCAWQRRFQEGAPIHTYYDGTPNVFRNFRWFGLSEIQAKRWLEPAFLLALGISCVTVSITTLGYYWIAAAVAVHVSVSVRLYQVREQALDSTDAVYDMMNHQAAVAAECQSQSSPPPTRPVVASSATPPCRTSPGVPPIAPPEAAVPSRLREGLDDNLQHLLDTPYVEQ